MSLGPGLWITFAYYFLGTTAIAALLGSRLLPGETSGSALLLAVPVGAVAGLLGAAFNRTERLSVTVRDPAAFRRDLDRALAELGFEADPTIAFDPESEFAGFSAYRRSQLGRWLSGMVLVRTDGTEATLASRASVLRRLERRLDRPARSPSKSSRSGRSA